MKKQITPRQVGLLLLYLGLGAASAVAWIRIMEYGRQASPGIPNTPLHSWHLDMIGGHAPAPNQYRPLLPWLAEFARLVLPSGDLATAYMILRGLVTGLGLYVMDGYLRTWFRPGAAAAGALFLAAIVPFTYYPMIQESDPLNLLAFVAAFWALAAGRDLWLIPLVLVGTLNRETTAMLPAVYLLARWGREPLARVLSRTGILVACWVAVYGGLLLLYGRREYYTDPVQLAHNFSSGLPLFVVMLTFGAAWVAPWLAGKEAPELLRRNLWLVPPFVVLQCVVARVDEVRLFLPLAPILIPLTWWVLLPESKLGPEPEAAKPRRRPA
jgi:hypothetical protein